MIRNWLSITIISGLTLAFIVLWDSPPTHFSTESVPDAVTTNSPSNTLTLAKTLSFNARGTLHYTVEATSTEYFRINGKQASREDYTNLSAPRLRLFQTSNTTPWHITSEYGQITDNGETITLWGNTKVWKIDENQQRSELISERLVVKPEQQFVETDKAVMLTTTGSTTHAKGMHAYLKEDKIVLLSNVRGTYEFN